MHVEDLEWQVRVNGFEEFNKIENSIKGATAGSGGLEKKLTMLDRIAAKLVSRFSAHSFAFKGDFQEFATFGKDIAGAADQVNSLEGRLARLGTILHELQGRKLTLGIETEAGHIDQMTKLLKGYGDTLDEINASYSELLKKQVQAKSAQFTGLSAYKQAQQDYRMIRGAGIVPMAQEAKHATAQEASKIKAELASNLAKRPELAKQTIALERQANWKPFEAERRQLEEAQLQAMIEIDQLKAQVQAKQKEASHIGGLAAAQEFRSAQGKKINANRYVENVVSSQAAAAEAKALEARRVEVERQLGAMQARAKEIDPGKLAGRWAESADSLEKLNKEIEHQQTELVRLKQEYLEISNAQALFQAKTNEHSQAMGAAARSVAANTKAEQELGVKAKQLAENLDAVGKLHESVPSTTFQAFSRQLDAINERIPKTRAQVRVLDRDISLIGQHSELSKAYAKQLGEMEELTKRFVAETDEQIKQRISADMTALTNNMEAVKDKAEHIQKQIVNPGDSLETKIAKRAQLADELKRLEVAKKYRFPFLSAMTSGQARDLDEYITKLKQIEKTQTTLGMQYRRTGFDVGFMAQQWGFATLAMGGFFTAASIESANFEKKMAEVNSITRYTPKAFAETKKEMVDLFTKLPVKNLDDLTNGLYNIRSSGVETADSMMTLEQSMKAAIAGQTDLNTASKAALGTLHAFSMPISDINKALDYQFKLVELGIGRYEDFQPVLGKLEVSARQANQSLATTYGSLAQLTRMNFNPRMASTALSRAYDIMIQRRGQMKENLGVDPVDKNTGQYKDFVIYLEEVNKKIKEGKVGTDALQKSFSNVFALRAVRSILSTLNDTKKLVNETANSAGTFERAYELATKNTADRIQLLKNSWHAMLLAVGDSSIVKSTTLGVINYLHGWTQRIQEMQPGLTDMIGLAGIATTALAGMGTAGLSAFSVLARGAGMFATTKGAAASYEVTKLAIGLAKVQDAVKGTEVVSEALANVGATAMQVEGAVALLRIALYSVAAVAVGYGIAKWVEHMYAAYDATVKEAKAGHDMADELLKIGDVIDRTSNAFKRQHDIIRDLQGIFPMLVDEYKSGGITLGELATKAKEASKSMSDAAKQKMQGTFINKFNVGLKSLIGRSPIEPVYGPQSETGRQTMRGRQYSSMYNSAADMAAAVASADRIRREALEASRGNIREAEKYIREQQQRLRTQSAESERKSIFSMNPEDSAHYREVSLKLSQRASMLDKGVVDVESFSRELEKSARFAVPRQLRKLTGFDSGQMISEALAQAEVKPGMNTYLDASTIKKVQAAIVSRMKKDIGLDKTRKALADSVDKAMRNAIQTEIDQKPWTDATERLSEIAVDQVAAKVTAAAEIAASGTGPNSQYVKVFKATLGQSISSSADALRRILVSSLDIQTPVPSRSEDWLFNETKKAAKAGARMIGENTPARAGDIIIVGAGKGLPAGMALVDEQLKMLEKTEAGAWGYSGGKDRFGRNRSGRTLADLVSGRPYYTIPANEAAAALYQSGAQGLLDISPDAQVEADKEEKRVQHQLARMRRQLDKNMRDAQLTGQVAALKAPVYGYGSKFEMTRRDFQAQSIEARQQAKNQIENTKEQLKDELTQIEGHEKEKNSIWRRYENYAEQLSNNASAELLRIEVERHHKIKALMLDEASSRQKYMTSAEVGFKQAYKNFLSVADNSPRGVMEAINVQFVIDKKNLYQEYRDAQAELARMLESGSIKQEEYAKYGRLLDQTYNKNKLATYLTYQKNVHDKINEYYRNESNSYMETRNAIISFNQSVVEANGSAVSERIAQTHTETKAKIEALDMEWDAYKRTANSEGKTLVEVKNEFARVQAEKMKLIFDEARAIRETQVEAYRESLDVFSDARRAVFDVRRSMTETIDSSYATRMRMVKEETELRIKEIETEEKKWNASLKVHEATESQKLNATRRFLAQKQQAYVDASKTLGELANEEVNTFLDAMRSATAMTAKQALAIARQTDNLLANSGMGGAERSKRLFSFLKDAIDEDRRNMEYLLDMLELPKRKMVAIRREMIDRGLIFGPDAIEAEKQNLNDLLDEVDKWKRNLRNTTRDTLASGIKDFVMGRGSISGMMVKLQRDQLESVLDSVLEQAFKPWFTQANKTPIEAAQEKMLYDYIRSTSYVADLSGVVSTAGVSIKDAAETFESGAQLFMRAVELDRQSKGLVSPQAPNLMPVPGSPNLPGASLPGTKFSTNPPAAGAGGGTVRFAAPGAKPVDYTSPYVPKGETWITDGFSITKRFEANGLQAHSYSGVLNHPMNKDKVTIKGTTRLTDMLDQYIFPNKVPHGMKPISQILFRLPTAADKKSKTWLEYVKKEQAILDRFRNFEEPFGEAYNMTVSQVGGLKNYETMNWNKRLKMLDRNMGLVQKKNLVPTEEMLKLHYEYLPKWHGKQYLIGHGSDNSYNSMDFVSDKGYMPPEKYVADLFKEHPEYKKDTIIESCYIGRADLGPQKGGYTLSTPYKDGYGRSVNWGDDIFDFDGEMSFIPGNYEQGVSKAKSKSWRRRFTDFIGLTPHSTKNPYVSVTPSGQGPSWNLIPKNANSLDDGMCGQYAREVWQGYGWKGNVVADVENSKYATKVEKPKFDQIAPGMIVRFGPSKKYPKGHWGVAMRDATGGLVLNEQFNGGVRQDRSISRQMPYITAAYSPKGIDASKVGSTEAFTPEMYKSQWTPGAGWTPEQEIPWMPKGWNSPGSGTWTTQPSKAAADRIAKEFWQKSSASDFADNLDSSNISSAILAALQSIDLHISAIASYSEPSVASDVVADGLDKVGMAYTPGFGSGAGVMVGSYLPGALGIGAATNLALSGGYASAGQKGSSFLNGIDSSLLGGTLNQLGMPVGMSERLSQMSQWDWSKSWREIKGKNPWGKNSMNTALSGVSSFMTGYSGSANLMNMASGTLTGLLTGGPVGAAIGFGSTVLGGFFGKKHRNKPKMDFNGGDFGLLSQPEDVMWATRNFVRRAAEGGREGLPQPLGVNRPNVVTTNANVAFARVEIVTDDPRSAGREFVAGLSEGPAEGYARNLSSGVSRR